MERRAFFQSLGNEALLAGNAKSSNPSLRWAAAVELGEIPEEWSILLLWELKDDVDQHVRSVAQKALSQFDPSVLEKTVFDMPSISPSGLDAERSQPRDSDGIEPHLAWKTRPLDPPSEENDWAVSAAVIDIVNTEGPLNGHRMLRLYGESVYPNSPRKLSKYRMRKAIERLRRRGVLSVDNDQDKENIENWILYRTGTPSVVVRTRGSRKLPEIPITEVAEVINRKTRSSTAPNRNRQFQAVLDFYEIPQNEFHVVGAVLDKEWRGLIA